LAVLQVRVYVIPVWYEEKSDIAFVNPFESEFCSHAVLYVSPDDLTARGHSVCILFVIAVRIVIAGGCFANVFYLHGRNFSLLEAIADENVVASASVKDVVALSAVESVVSGPTMKAVIARATSYYVISRSTVYAVITGTTVNLVGS